MKALPNRWWLIGPWAVFAALVIGWTAYWFILSGETIKRLEAAKADATSPFRLTYERVETTGYPFRLLAVLTAPRLEGADGGFTLSAPRGQLAVNVLNPNHVMAFAESPIRWRGLDLDWTISAERAEASARWDGQGRLGEVRASLVRASITAPDRPASRADLLTLALRPDPQDSGARQIALTAEGFAPAGLKGFEGFTAKPFTLKAGVVVEQAGLIQFGADPLSAWGAAGAKLRVERFQADPAGLKITAEGGFGLDAERRPNGALTLEFDDVAAGLRAAMQSSTIPETARTAAQTFSLGQGLAGGAVNIPLTAATGRWRLGPIDLGPAAPVYPVQ